jgi:hypothetical protein
MANTEDLANEAASIHRDYLVSSGIDPMMEEINRIGRHDRMIQEIDRLHRDSGIDRIMQEIGRIDRHSDRMMQEIDRLHRDSGIDRMMQEVGRIDRHSHRMMQEIDRLHRDSGIDRMMQEVGRIGATVENTSALAEMTRVHKMIESCALPPLLATEESRRPLAQLRKHRRDAELGWEFDERRSFTLKHRSLADPVSVEAEVRFLQESMGLAPRMRAIVRISVPLSASDAERLPKHGYSLDDDSEKLFGESNGWTIKSIEPDGNECCDLFLEN